MRHPGRDRTREPFKSRKGFGFKVRQARASASGLDRLGHDLYDD